MAHWTPLLWDACGAHGELAARTIDRRTTADGVRGVAATAGDADAPTARSTL